MHKNYPSNVSQEQFENIKLILENSKKRTKPRSLDLYEVFCAILYVLKSGCQWRMLLKKFCMIRKMQKIMKKLWKKIKY